MSRLAGVWIVVLLAVAAMAGSVEFAARAQETAADTDFSEAQNATDMSVAMLQQERGLDGFVATLTPSELEPYFTGKTQLADDLTTASRVSSDDPVELGLVREQQTIEGKWEASTTLELAQAESGRRDVVSPADDASDKLITAFLAANSRYQARLAANRHREENGAALVPLWLIGGLSCLFGVSGWLYMRRMQKTRALVTVRERKARAHEVELTAAQARLAEAMQVAESQGEVHAIVAHYLRDAVPGSEVAVLNRNNSADRLESTMPLPEGHPLTVALQTAKPRSCVAVRLARQYQQERGGKELLACDICGTLPTASTCQPLLVGGEVIGSILLTRTDALDSEGQRLLVGAVSQAAPVLANLRNLALAENRAATDALTGLPNRRAVDDTLKRMLALADRTAGPFSVVLLDLDHFKQINDTFGHDRGDDVLAAFGALLRNELRESDLAGRTGGEEFVILLPDTNTSGAVQIAEKIRAELHDVRIKGVDRTITASFGAATYPADAPDSATLLRIADRALYTAKQNGRDRVETATNLPAQPPPQSSADPSQSRNGSPAPPTIASTRQ